MLRHLQFIVVAIAAIVATTGCSKPAATPRPGADAKKPPINQFGKGAEELKDSPL